MSAIFTVLLYSTQFTAWPEMLVWPYLHQGGFAYYSNIFVVYPPLLLSILSLVSSNHWDVTMLQLITTAVLLFNLSLFVTELRKRHSSLKLLIFVSFLLIIWQIRYEANGLWFDHLLTPLLFITYSMIYRGRLLLASIFFSFAILTKQTAVVMLIPIMYSLNSSRQFLRFILLSGFLAIAGYLLMIPTESWLTAVQQNLLFPIQHMASHSGQRQLPQLNQLILFLLPIVMLAVSFFAQRQKSSKIPRQHRELMVWYLFSLIGIWPRFELFHVLPSLNFLLLLLFLLLTNIKIITCRRLIITILSITSLLVFLEYYHDYRALPPRFIEQTIISESQHITNIVGDETIFTTNSWDHWYYLINKYPNIDFIYPSTPLYYDYPGVQELTVSKLLDSQPVYILLGSNSAPQLILNYIDNYYVLHEEIDSQTFLYRKSHDN